MNNKGNAIAIVLVAIVIISLIAISVQEVGQNNISGNMTSSEIIKSETKTAIITGINNSANAFAESGLSEQTKYWYINGQIPPDFNEAKSAFESILDKKISQILGDLKTQRGYDFNLDLTKVTVNIPQKLSEANKEVVNFDYNVLVFVKDKDTNDYKELLIQGRETLPYKIWFIYEKSSEWSNDLNSLTNDVKKILQNTIDCQIEKCNCHNNENNNYVRSKEELMDYVNNNYGDINGPGLENLKNDFNSIVNTQVNLLNAKFDLNSRIECGYEIKEYEFDIDINSYQKCIGPNEVEYQDCEGQDFANTSNPQSFVTWIDKITAEDVNVYGERLNGGGFSTRIAGKRETLPCENMKDEFIAANPRVYMDIEVNCKDKSTITSVAGEVKNFEFKFGLKIAIQKNCDINEDLKLDTPTMQCTQEPNPNPGPGQGGGDNTCTNASCCKDACPTQFGNPPDDGECYRLDCETCKWIKINCVPGDCGESAECTGFSTDPNSSGYNPGQAKCKITADQTKCSTDIDCMSSYCSVSYHSNGSSYAKCIENDTCEKALNPNKCGKLTCNRTSEKCEGTFIDCTQNPVSSCEEPICTSSYTCSTKEKTCPYGQICSSTVGNCVPAGSG